MVKVMMNNHLMNEKTYSHDITTAGGNTSLFMLPDKE